MALCCERASAKGIQLAAIIERVHRSKVPVFDTLLLAEFIDWFTSQTLAEAGTICDDEEAPGRDRVNQTFTDACLKLYGFCGRTFIIQLLYSTAKNDFRSRVGRNEYDSIMGCVRFFHQELCRCEGGCYANVLDLGEILDVCLARISDEFERYSADRSSTEDSSDPQKIGSRNRRKRQTHDEGELEKPSEGAASKIKADTTKNNLTKGNTTENYNYRSAYTMMVGLDSSIRLKEAMKIYRVCMLGVGTFSSLVQTELTDQGFAVFASAVMLKQFAEAQMASDAVLLCMSAITLKFDLPSAGSAFSRRHLLGDDENLWLEEYAPALFSECRKIFDISEDGYKRSVARTGFSFIEFASNSKSGEMFFFSWDGKYIIKTISEKEVYVMIKMLPKYVLHVAKPSLLMRICGLYRVSVSSEYPPRYFLIAISVFDAGDMGLHHQFDLKGSTSGRMSAPADSVQKDLNWVAQGMQVCLPAGLKRTIAAALENDARFLKEQSVLDYSVLVGIHDRQASEAGKQNKGVRLLQGIVKQKLMPWVKSHRVQKTQSLVSPALSSSLPDATLATSKQQEPAGSSPCGVRRHSEPVLSARTSANMDWITSGAKVAPRDPCSLQGSVQGSVKVDLNQHCGPALSSGASKGISGLLVKGSTGSPPISRLPSCMSDPYEESEMWLGDGDDMYPAVDTMLEEWQALRAWLPPLESSALNQTTELSAGATVPAFESVGSHGGLESFSEDSSSQSLSVDTLVRELDALARLGRFDSPLSQGESVCPQGHKEYDVELSVGSGGGFVPLQQHPPPPVSALAIPLLTDAREVAPRRQKLSSLLEGYENERNEESDKFPPLPAPRPGLIKELSTTSATSAGAAAGSQSLLRRSVKSRRPDPNKDLHVFRDLNSSANPSWKGMHGPISSGNVGGEFGRYVYYIGIIDFLIPWDSKKKAEYAWNCARGRGTSASCVPPTVYAKRQTDFVLRAMMGLFDAQTAHLYSSATVTIPPPKLLQLKTSQNEKPGVAAAEQANECGAGLLVKSADDIHQNRPAQKGGAILSKSTSVQTPSLHQHDESADDSTAMVNVAAAHVSAASREARRGADGDRQDAGSKVSDESPSRARFYEENLIESLEFHNQMKRMTRGSPVRMRKTQNLSDKLSSSLLGDAIPGGPERGGAESSPLYDIDEDDGQEDVGSGMSEKQGTVNSQGHVGAPPSTPAHSVIKKRQNTNAYATRLKQAQADTESLSSQVSALMASLEQAKRSASVVMVDSSAMTQ